MKKPETKFKEKVIKDLKQLPDVWLVKTQNVAIHGTPDILGCKDGLFFALELKASEKSRATKLQEWNLEKIKKAGGYGEITYPENWAFVFGKLTRMKKENI